MLADPAAPVALPAVSPRVDPGLSPAQDDEPTPKPLGREEVRAALQRACAIVHGYGKGMSLLQLVSLILEQGLPDETTRAQMLAEKLSSNHE